MLDVSLLTCLVTFLPNLRTELALSMSCSVVLLIGTVPSGHDSPDILHSWKSSVSIPECLWSLGLSGGSYKSNQHFFNPQKSSLSKQPKRIQQVRLVVVASRAKYQWLLPSKLRMIESWLQMRNYTIYKIAVRTLHQKKQTQNKYKNRGKFELKIFPKSNLVHAWIVLRAGLLMFLRRALMNLSFFSSLCGRSVWLVAWKSPVCSDAWAGGREEEETRKKNTRMGMIGDKILWLHQLEAIFVEFLVCFLEPGCCCCCCCCVLHWRCLLLWYSKIRHHNNLIHLGFVVHENVAIPTSISIPHIVTILTNPNFYSLSLTISKASSVEYFLLFSSLSFWGSSRASNTLVFMFWQLELQGTSSD